MHLDTYLSFDGNTREAFEFYARHLGGEITQMTTFGDSEARAYVPAAVHDKIMHGRIAVGGSVLMATDATPEHPYRGKIGMHVVYQADEPADAERVFAALADGGKVEMPIAKTFWARAYGIVTDRFDTPWMVNCT
jgi:PhnB protein